MCRHVAVARPGADVSVAGAASPRDAVSREAVVASPRAVASLADVTPSGAVVTPHAKPTRLRRGAAFSDSHAGRPTRAGRGAAATHTREASVKVKAALPATRGPVARRAVTDHAGPRRDSVNVAVAPKANRAVVQAAVAVRRAVAAHGTTTPELPRGTECRRR